MKKNKIKLLITMIIISMLILAGCSSNSKKISSDSEEVFKIGISQLAEHPALDDARRGFEDGLKEHGINAEIEYKMPKGGYCKYS